MAGEGRKRSAPRRASITPLISRPARGCARQPDAAAAATRIAAVLAFAALAASGASVHALVFWAAALFLVVRLGDLEGLLEDNDRHR